MHAIIAAHGENTELFIRVLIFFLIPLTVVAGVIAAKKGNSVFVAVILSIFLSPIVGITVALLKKPNQSGIPPRQSTGTVRVAEQTRFYSYKTLFEWMFQHRLPDQWYVAVNGHKRDQLYTLEQVRQFYLSSPSSRIEVLNSQLATGETEKWLLYREVDTSSEMRKQIGILLIIGGLICSIYFAAYSTSVSTEFGGVHNVGLMQNRELGLVAGIIALVAGLILVATAKHFPTQTELLQDSDQQTEAKVPTASEPLAGAAGPTEAPDDNHSAADPDRPITQSAQSSTRGGVAIKSAAILFGVVFIDIGIFGFFKGIGLDQQNLLNVASGLAALLCCMGGVGASRRFFRIYGIICVLVALLGFYYFGVVEVKASRRANQIRLNASQRETEEIADQISKVRTIEDRNEVLAKAVRAEIEAEAELTRFRENAPVERHRFRTNMAYNGLQLVLAVAMLCLGFISNILMASIAVLFLVLIAASTALAYRHNRQKFDNQSTPQLNANAEMPSSLSPSATPAKNETPKEVKRLAPGETVYNVVRLSVRMKSGLAGIEPGTELKIISENADGSLHVQTGSLVADVPASAVTDDLRVAAAAQKAGQDALNAAAAPSPTPKNFLWP